MMQSLLNWISENSGLIQLILLLAVLPALRAYLRKRTEQGANTDLLGALTRGAEFALGALQNAGAGPVTRQMVVEAAIEYARRSQPEALERLAPSRTQLERVAQAQAEPVLRAAVTAAATAGLPAPVALPGSPLDAIPANTSAVIASIFPPRSVENVK